MLALLGYNADSPESADETSSPASKAIAELDQWDGPSFARAQAALAHKHPEQAGYVFAGLTAKSGADSIAAVGTFLDRIAILRAGSDPDRKETKASDKAAVELLAKRRILDAKVEARLRGLIDTATALAPASKTKEAEPEDRQVTAQKLGAWLDDWRETARALVTRRDYRIALGLAQRRKPLADEHQLRESAQRATVNASIVSKQDLITGHLGFGRPRDMLEHGPVRGAKQRVHRQEVVGVDGRQVPDVAIQLERRQDATRQIDHPHLVRVVARLDQQTILVEPPQQHATKLTDQLFFLEDWEDQRLVFIRTYGDARRARGEHDPAAHADRRRPEQCLCCARTDLEHGLAIAAGVEPQRLSLRPKSVRHAFTVWRRGRAVIVHSFPFAVLRRPLLESLTVRQRVLPERETRKRLDF